VTMPRLSDTMTEGTVATWLNKVGDKIAEGDILAEMKPIKQRWSSSLSTKLYCTLVLKKAGQHQLTAY
jgi:multidrug efflux pump subunit AcrA (membrane-fusion protein)